MGLMPGLTSLRRMLRRDLRILAYHRVLEVADPTAFDFDLNLVSASPEQFRRQMLLVRQRFNPMSFHDLIVALDNGSPLPPQPLIITFDDGYEDNYSVAFPILRELGVPATFFVSTGHIDNGTPYAYDWLVHAICRTDAARLQVAELGIDLPIPDARAGRRELAEELLFGLKGLSAELQGDIIARLEQGWGMPCPPAHPQCRPMTWDQLREMQAAGMDIGSHGVSHRMLAKLPAAEMVAEIRQSKESLERELGVPAEVLSYPVGGPDAYDEDVIAAARDAGYRMGCAYLNGINRLPPASHYALRRLSVEREMDLAWFAAMTALPEVFAYRKRLRIG
jgi:peptidoglycan/xylan/chitin deacetylase (PgdA/CDA1 family)